MVHYLNIFFEQCFPPQNRPLFSLTSVFHHKIDPNIKWTCQIIYFIRQIAWLAAVNANDMFSRFNMIHIIKIPDS